jgi:ribose 5-phosphate isomerase B
MAGGRSLSHQTRIALGSDHAGFALKEKVRAYLASKGYDVEDLGPATPERVDYPDYAERVAAHVAAKKADFGFLVCGTGLGVAIAANKVRGIRAATCNDTLSAYFARAHNDANVLTMGGRLIDEATARKIIETWLSTEFEGGRHALRVKKIAMIGEKNLTETSS